MSKMGGGGGASNAELVLQAKRDAKRNEYDELRRSQRLGRGNEVIDAIFDGGMAPGKNIGLQANFDPEAVYYGPNGEVVEFDAYTGEPMKPNFNKVAGDNWSGSYQRWFGPNASTKTEEKDQLNAYARYLVDQSRKLQKLNSEGKVFASQGREYDGIGDEFYGGFRDAYLTPYLGPEWEGGFSEEGGLGQLGEAFLDAREEDQYDLARRGLLDSSASVMKSRDLLDDYADNRESVLTRADEQLAGLRDSVSQGKARSRELLYMTEDPTRAANAAINETNMVQLKTPTINPLGDVFDSLGRAVQSFNTTRQNRAVMDAYKAASPFGGGSGRNYG